MEAAAANIEKKQTGASPPARAAATADSPMERRKSWLMPGAGASSITCMH